MYWLRDLPIWSKLGFIMIVPTIATVVVGAVGLSTNISRAGEADRSRILAGLASDAGCLVNGLQNERAAAVIQMTAPNIDNTAAFDKAATAAGPGTPVAKPCTDEVDKDGKPTPTGTDAAVKRYQVRRAALVTVPSKVQATLDAIDGKLAGLAKLRTQVRNGVLDNGAAVKLTDVLDSYGTTIDNLLTLRQSAAQLAGDENVAGDLRSLAELATAKEYLAQQRVVVLRGLAQRSFNSDLRRSFLSTEVGQEQSAELFRKISTADQRNLYNQTVAGPVEDLYQQDRRAIENIASDSLPGGIFSSAQWDAAVLARSNLIRKVEVTLDARTVDEATALRNTLQRGVLVQTALLLAMLLLAVVFAWMVARTMARALRHLRHGALNVARHSLPQAVARLRDPSLSTHLSPEQIAMQIAEPLPVRSRDEFGQVTEAFNAVHLEAVRTAAEQAALRSSVSQMFVNLARRSQILVDRLIGHLDRIERGEEDPDRLAELFQLDHLATRMRRNDENLLVLAGADSTRIQRDAAPMLDVLRAAQSEVEHYTRVEFGMIDRDIELAAHAVNDVVHLVAELFDNATAFSPPDAPVIVEARRVGDRVVLLVEDRGIGISHDQLMDLNERLANPPMVDVAVSRMMGLVVVARLAGRLGVKVELRPARERGTIADVTLPSGVLIPRALGGRASAGLPAAGQQAGSPFGAPVALEAGPAALPHRGSGAMRGDVAAAVGGIPAFGNGAGFGSAGQRSQPPWSDLVGANGNGNGAEMRPGPGQSLPMPGGESLPHRRAGEAWSNSPLPETDDGPMIPRQRPQLPGGPDDSRPSAWPPVPEPLPSYEDGFETIGSPRAAADLTAEIPRITDGWGPPDQAAPVEATIGSLGGEAGRRFVDMTMELPIFREVESAWFRNPSPESSIDLGGGPLSGPTGDLPAPVGVGMTGTSSLGSLPRRGDRTGTTPGDHTPPVEPPRETWRTAADEGWRVAAAVASTDKGQLDTTEKGLPKRVPMTQLVPGGVERATTSQHRRTPEAVRGLLSAYHRGVQRGRGSRPGDAENTTAGPQNSQGGKEHEA